MNILAISGSARTHSTNTALLQDVAKIAAPSHRVTVYAGIAQLPVFSPDAETSALPATVQSFVEAIRASDALIISSPEYVRSIPGGLKNAIDWLVSRDEIVHKPIALLHASHRGNEMLDTLRLVLATVSEKFTPDLFLRFELMGLSTAQIQEQLSHPNARAEVLQFLQGLERRVTEQPRG
jgi:NAD(P)H-dependent FMN reductase